jgi:predicted SAM-dependent methyltransferase
MEKYYGPITSTYDYLSKYIKPTDKVLELGPGDVPFPYATHFCGWSDKESEKLSNYKAADFSKGKLPYEDKEFDFIYCRHVLEDLYNPFNCMDEMSRIGKKGYIECPSPIIEMCYNAENYIDSNAKEKWRGYQHHHNFVWNDGILNFLHKYPIVEKVKFEEKELYNLLKHPVIWNTYYLWKDKIEYRLYEHPKDYSKPSDNSYFDIIFKAMEHAQINAQSLLNKLNEME